MADCAVAGADAPDAPDGLTWSSDDQPGIHRRPVGKGFSYRDAKGAPIRRRSEIERIRHLAIPPAWTDVWICPTASGHIQATGRDARGRKQYRYHSDWSTARANNKFDKMPAFAKALPRLRAQIEHDLSRPGAGREKVLATTVRLLELTLIRVGNVEYARQNRSYGLTTLHKRHLCVDGSALRFSFRGKSGIEHHVSVRDRRLSGVLRSLRDLPGQGLFKYRDAEGAMCLIRSEDVNAYIRTVIGNDFSAKDFRTWAGTVSAARILRDLGQPDSPMEARRQINLCLRTVSRLLGNTPAVCRASYVHPTVLALHRNGELQAALPGSEATGFEAALMRRLVAEVPAPPPSG